MQNARIGRFLLALGLLVGIAAVLGLLVDFDPARLPAGLLTIAVYKLSFIAVLGLFVAGAVLVRRARSAPDRGELTEGRIGDVMPGGVAPSERVAADRRVDADDR